MDKHNTLKMKLLTTFALIITCLYGTAQSTFNKNYVEYQVNVAPNPADGPITISAPEGATCKLVSYKGAYIGTWKITEEKLVVKNLEPGQYVAMIEYMGKKTTKKIVVL